MIGLGAVISVIFIGVGGGTGSIDIPETVIHLDTDLIEPAPIFIGDIREEVAFRVPTEWLGGSVFANAVDQLLGAPKSEPENDIGPPEAEESVEEEAPLSLEELMTDLNTPWDELVEFDDYIEILPEDE